MVSTAVLNNSQALENTYHFVIYFAKNSLNISIIIKFLFYCPFVFSLMKINVNLSTMQSFRLELFRQVLKQVKLHLFSISNNLTMKSHRWFIVWSFRQKKIYIFFFSSFTWLFTVTQWSAHFSLVYIQK